MKKSDWFVYLALGSIPVAYVIGEATGYLFFAMLYILPVWAWLLTGGDENHKSG
jgi:hypothetical protein